MAALWKFTHPKSVALYDAHEDLPLQTLSKGYIPRYLRKPVARFARALERLADRALDGIVAATPRLTRNFGNPNTISVENFPWRDAFSSSDRGTDMQLEPIRISYIGAVTIQRGIAEMLDACDQLQDRVHLLIAGPIQGDGAAQRMANLPTNVTYLGTVSPATVPDILSHSHIGLAVLHANPNYLEAQSSKIYEYMAASIPFIASDFPAWKANLAEARAGLFIEPGNARALSDAITCLLDDPSERDHLGRNGRQAFEDRFSFDAQAQKLTALIERLSKGVRAA